MTLRASGCSKSQPTEHSLCRGLQHRLGKRLCLGRRASAHREPITPPPYLQGLGHSHYLQAGYFSPRSHGVGAIGQKHIRAVLLHHPRIGVATGRSLRRLGTTRELKRLGLQARSGPGCSASAFWNKAQA